MPKVNRLIYVVNHKETGQAAGALYFQHEILEVRACQGVDSGKGFVHQKYDWLVCHGASYSDALLHTSPQLPGISAFESFTAELFQCCSSSFVQFASGHSARGERKRDIPQNSKPRQKGTRVLLKHKRQTVRGGRRRSCYRR